MGKPELTARACKSFLPNRVLCVAIVGGIVFRMSPPVAVVFVVCHDRSPCFGDGSRAAKYCMLALLVCAFDSWHECQHVGGERKIVFPLRLKEQHVWDHRRLCQTVALLTRAHADF